jgi:hypothetical protein
MNTWMKLGLVAAVLLLVGSGWAGSGAPMPQDRPATTANMRTVDLVRLAASSQSDFSQCTDRCVETSYNCEANCSTVGCRNSCQNARVACLKACGAK